MCKLRFYSASSGPDKYGYLRKTGIVTGFEVELSTFSHWICRLVSSLEAVTVRLLVITSILFVLDLLVRIPNAFISRLVCKGSLDTNSSLFWSITHASLFELPVAQTQVTASPGHTDCLSQSTEISLSVKSECHNHNSKFRFGAFIRIQPTYM